MDLWGDESGEPTFTNMDRPYFIVGTMACHDPNLPADLLRLRVELAKLGQDLPDGFHSITNPPVVRDRVLNILSQRTVQMIATVIDKRHMPGEYREPEQFYWWAWYQHHKYFLPGLLRGERRPPFLAVATYGTEGQRARFAKALNAGLAKSVPEITERPRFAFWPAATHPCLQAADLLLWAIQRAEVGGDFTHLGRLKRQVGEIRRL